MEVLINIGKSYSNLTRFLKTHQTFNMTAPAEIDSLLPMNAPEDCRS